MQKYNNRIAAQSIILDMINKYEIGAEQLYGLAKNAITRWVISNNIDANSNLVQIIFEISNKLFMLANKSQEQIADDVCTISCEIKFLSQKLERALVKAAKI